METATHYTSSAVESLRDEHWRVRRDLRHAEIMTEVLPEERLSGQRRNRMQAIGVILDDCLRAHRAWEERVLAPLIGTTPDPAMKALAPEIRALIRESGARLPDAPAFATRLERVVRAFSAHLEQERQSLRRRVH